MSSYGLCVGNGNYIYHSHTLVVIRKRYYCFPGWMSMPLSCILYAHLGSALISAD